MSILDFFKGLGKFFANLFKAAEKHIEDLDPETKKIGIDAAFFSQIIKENVEAAEADVNNLLKEKLHLTDEQLQGVFAIIRAKYNIPDAFTVTKWLQIKFHDITDDILHNSLANELFSVYAIEMSDGKLNWITLAMGVGEVLYRKFVKGAPVKIMEGGGGGQHLCSPGYVWNGEKCVPDVG